MWFNTTFIIDANVARKLANLLVENTFKSPIASLGSRRLLVA
jgi:hypothetical protein